MFPEEIDDIDLHWMSRACELAKIAAAHEEVPVGAVLINSDNQCVGQGCLHMNTQPSLSADLQRIPLMVAVARILIGGMLFYTLYLSWALQTNPVFGGGSYSWSG